MLSSVLNSKTAIKMNIAIVRTFVALRKVAINYHEIMRILTKMRGKYDAQFKEVYAVLEELVNPPRERIGFRRLDEME